MTSFQFQDEKVYFSERRILSFVFILTMSAIAPWYIVALCILASFFFFEMYTEGVCLALIFDVVYGPGAGIFSGFLLSIGALTVYSIFYTLDLQPFARAHNEV